ncbi:hypothetical protein BO82DRAFT_48019 [Aspergillus uvarum CBS 121591]|uniref:Uncharacterized protein n=1 Tax=Aspergillus uvarum CBS 121591 TaxID=1448315 RepID=A0A319DV20_9EURO|nr:hypothetical protein BO82DRAFT_48019 [Aspergillus uvarum CBS 121591]PYH82922.1 hypothetical protein BO82DRAFT_48019 [Aspergillus uvarum CBS 121591]
MQSCVKARPALDGRQEVSPLLLASSSEAASVMTRLSGHLCRLTTRDVEGIFGNSRLEQVKEGFDGGNADGAVGTSGKRSRGRLDTRQLMVEMGFWTVELDRQS